jgi:hypothetical protein
MTKIAEQQKLPNSLFISVRRLVICRSVIWHYVIAVWLFAVQLFDITLSLFGYSPFSNRISGSEQINYEY